MFVLLYGCKQTAHIEANKHDTVPIAIDSTAFVPERITDTITLVLDSAAVSQDVTMDTTHAITADTLMTVLDSIVETQILRLYRTQRPTTR